MPKHHLTTERERASRAVSNPPPIDGVHCIVDLHDCRAEYLDDVDYLQSVIEEAASRCGSRLLQITSQPFEPQGVTILGLLAESHISIHTWPELAYAAMDLFTCHRDSDLDAAVAYVIRALEARSHDRKVIRRGPRGR